MTEPVGSAIAIVGLSCRFPGAADGSGFWRLLRAGDEAISTFSCDQMVAAGVASELAADSDYVPARGMATDLERFDAAVFGYAPREAELLDPQHRIGLELAWQALEAAGHDPARFDGLIGVFAGSGHSGAPAAPAPTDDLAAAIGVSKDHMALRVSHKLDLKGPSLSVQTACSTSLVATHLACQSLLSGECDLALAGGANVTLPQHVGYLYRPQGILSPDGHCRAFDADARGTVPGNGAGMVVLRRLEEALADGDRVLAVIRGSAINNDGGDKVAYTAPGVAGQAQVVAEALAVSEVAPETIGYVEAHGTGTALGDPVEIAALSEAFASRQRGYCALGSVKSNIGHLDVAAGIAGLIKTILALHHREIPPSLHCRQPNPQIAWAASPFFVNTKLRPWPNVDSRDASSRRAGVSSFGIGGTNAHMILEEAPKLPPSGRSRPLQLVLLSAHSAASLQRSSSALADHFDGKLCTSTVDTTASSAELADAAYTLSTGRAVLEHRLAFVCCDPSQGVQALRRCDSGQHRDSGRIASGRSRERPVVFVFPGQGAQRIEMGRGLYRDEAVFRRTVDHCSDLLRPELGLDLRTVLYPAASSRQQATAELAETRLAQPALFVVGYGLAKLWMSVGVRPAAMLGHSVGEWVAACLAGVLSLDDALRLVAVRGRRVQQLPAGAMLSVPLAADELRPRLAAKGDVVAVAAINAPALCSVSGPLVAIADLERELAADGVPTRRLAVSHGFHSAAIDPVLEPFEREVAACALAPPSIPYLSNVTGDWIRAEDATDPCYWARHLRQTVRFDDGLQRLLENPQSIFLEAGPASLGALIRRRVRDGDDEHRGTANGNRVVSTLETPQHDQGLHHDQRRWLDALGQLWLAGAAIDWPRFWEGQSRHRTLLPLYPFKGRRFEAGGVVVPARRQDVGAWTYLPCWRQTAPLQTAPRQTVPRQTVLATEVPRSSGNPQLAWMLSDDEALAQTLSSVTNVRRLDPADDPSTWLDAPELKGDLPVDVVLAAGTASFDRLLLFVRSWARRFHRRPLRLTVMTSRALAVTGDEELAPETAAWLGALRVVPQEQPEIRCRLVDVQASATGVGPDMHDALVAELAGWTSDPVVALRRGRRWIPEVQAARFDRRRGEARLRPGGVVLITGGLGRLGSVMAERLLQHGLAVVLVGRSPGERQLADNQVVACADVADREAMAEVVERVQRQLGSITGIIHAAGVAPERLIRDESVGSMAAAQRAKVDGTQVLAGLFQDSTLDFFVLFSSISSLIGGVGFGAYAAANAFLEASAVRCYDSRVANSRMTAVSWGPWRDLAGSPSSPTGSRWAQQRRLDGIHPDEGWEAFLRCLGADVPHIIVSPTDVHAEIARSRSVETAPDPGEASAIARSAVEAAFAAPRSETEERLTALWQEVLGLERVGVDDNFLELGGHSLIALQILARLRQQDRIEISLDRFFATLTVAELARTVDRQQAIRSAAESEEAAGAEQDVGVVRVAPVGAEVLEEGEL